MKPQNLAELFGSSISAMIMDGDSFSQSIIDDLKIVSQSNYNDLNNWFAFSILIAYLDKLEKEANNEDKFNQVNPLETLYNDYPNLLKVTEDRKFNFDKSVGEFLDSQQETFKLFLEKRDAILDFYHKQQYPEIYKAEKADMN